MTMANLLRKISSSLVMTVLLISTSALAEQKSQSPLPKVITQEQFDRLSQGKTLNPAPAVAAGPEAVATPSPIGGGSRNHADYYQKVYQTEYASWGIRPENIQGYIHLEAAWDQFEKGRDITVAVVDTGIDPEHPFLKDNITIFEGNKSPTNFGRDFTQARPGTGPFDSHGHGTHVSGIIKSIFPEVKIVSLKYFNPQASNNQNLDASIKALRYAVDNGADIINYSGGGPEPSADELKILKDAETKGIIVVAAAGNEQSDIDRKDKSYYPASYGLSNIISVTAHDESVQILNTANFGKNSVDISAPGFRVTSSLPGSRSGKMTGTSQATAFVTGVVSMIKSQYPNLSAREIKEIIGKSSDKKPGLMNKCLYGGKLHAGRALELAKLVNQRKEGPRQIAGDQKK